MKTDFGSGSLLVKQELQKHGVQISHTGQIINSTKTTQSCDKLLANIPDK